MKLSESWLREWVNPDVSREKLCDLLTMAGLEVDELAPAAGEFDKVIVGRVEKLSAHPEADRLQVCTVSIDETTKLQIVCGAKNVKAGMRVAVALIGAQLPDGTKIKAAELRGIASQGMLCSSSELGLTEESEGLLELPAHAPIGSDVKSLLQLDDYVIDIAITPNRGDCLSIKGIAREVSAITGTSFKDKPIDSIKAAIQDTFDVLLESPEKCPRYVGRVIRNVKADLPSPVWLKERLRRSGIRSISPIVDVTNYVMLEIGQPMHAFDLDKLSGRIHIRTANTDENIELLDGSKHELDKHTLVIADDKSPLAIAGVMGGLDSGVSTLTKHIFLESAFFKPDVVARQRQNYQLNSDSAYRFERGVDAEIQRIAIERATQLILDIAGGEAGPVIEQTDKSNMPPAREVKLTKKKLDKVLGLEIPHTKVNAYLERLGFQDVKICGDVNGEKLEQIYWTATVPSHRFDILISEDLIEEIARLHGYDNIPTHTLRADLDVYSHQETDRDYSALKSSLAQHGYQEVVTYSFVDKKLQTLCDPEIKTLSLVNPISADMSVMRSSLWPGLLNTLMYNQRRQQTNIRLFETGNCFVLNDAGKVTQTGYLGGIATGHASPEQWGVTSRNVDFYDVKGDLEHVIGITFGIKMTFEPGKHPALHPGQTANILLNGMSIGTIGTLHPAIQKALDLDQPAILFELGLNHLSASGKSLIRDVSKFPEIRRDVAILVNETVPAATIQDTIKEIAGDWLKDVFIFDVYHGKGVSPDLKSVALALIWQHPTRTLVDEEITGLMERVIDTLKRKLGAELRS